MNPLRVVLFTCFICALGLKFAEHSRNTNLSNQPRVAVLLVGIPRNWDTDFVSDLLDGMVNIHSADVFVSMCDKPDNWPDGLDLAGLVKQIGNPVKKVYDAGQDELTAHGAIGPLTQFWHVRKAFDLMEEYEEAQGFTYDVVIKMRTELSPAHENGATLDLAGWEKEGRVHMLSDKIFWGPRQEMSTMADFFFATQNFYTIEHPDPFARPIDVKALYETYMRDPRNSPNATIHPPWGEYNKLESVPYPDMGGEGAIANLQAALDKGITECPSQRCSLRCGERYDVLCANGGGFCGKFGCKANADYAVGSVHSEKDILTWPLANGIIVCDVGKSFTFYRNKLGVHPRSVSRDCDE